MRSPIQRFTLVTAVACGFGLGGAMPAVAGTVLRGKVTLPATVPANSTDGFKGSPAPTYPDVVVYVTEKPGGTRLAGRGVRKDIDLDGDRFQPAIMAITVQSKVRFRNRDHVYHSLFSVTPAGRTELGSLAPGARREVRFDRTGVSNLFCLLHPASAGFVMVCPNWFYTRPNAAGEYTLPPLPRGSYLVHAWHPLLGDIQRSIDVTGRDVVRFDLGF